MATSSGIISHYYNLHVVVPAAFILGNGDYHIGEGSTISLVCIIENVSSETLKYEYIYVLSFLGSGRVVSNILYYRHISLSQSRLLSPRDTSMHRRF